MWWGWEFFRKLDLAIQFHFQPIVSQFQFRLHVPQGIIEGEYGWSRDDMYAPDSIDLLKNSGIDFKRNEEEGIDVEYFGELLITSGLVLFDNVKWVSFHSYVPNSHPKSSCTCWSSTSPSISGYDFGYLLKILTCEPLPSNETDFFHLLSIWFPCIYDIKHVVRSVKTLRGGLQEIAESLGVRWRGKLSSIYMADMAWCTSDRYNG